MRFLFPTDQKCTESSTYWQFFYYRPPGKFWYIQQERLLKCDAKNSTYIYLYIYRCDPLNNRYGFFISVQPEIDCTTFHSFFSVFEKKNGFVNFQKLAGLWLVGVVVNHVGIYEYKVAEGFSAFQHRSCNFYHCCLEQTQPSWMRFQQRGIWHMILGL